MQTAASTTHFVGIFIKVSPPVRKREVRTTIGPADNDEPSRLTDRAYLDERKPGCSGTMAVEYSIHLSFQRRRPGRIIKIHG
jgi:hypothetical protein